MPLYEHVFIARQDISGAQVDGITDQFADLIKEQGGSVETKEYWGLRNLAYKIKKNRKAHYVLLNIDAPADTIKELERQERIHDDVLRYLTLRVDAFDEGPSVMMQSKGRRREDEDEGEERGRRRGREGEERPKEAKPKDEKPAEAKPKDEKPKETAKAEAGAEKETAAEEAPSEETEEKGE